jgi:hypothetical protein
MSPEEKQQYLRINAALDAVIKAYEEWKTPKHLGRPRSNEKDLRKFVYRSESCV